ncbi:unnamed protein product [Rotaria sp. Silwood2]|nr:unnamed protein product [Rotaria sp. Silwood2]CAF3956196.1 unnamed protein product [Rotaria sp. Silwood2]
MATSNMSLSSRCRRALIIDGIGSGFHVIDPLDGTFVLFSCAISQIASDILETGQHSIFTKYLLKHIANPNEHIVQIFQGTAADVFEESNGVQKPLCMNGLLRRGHIYLNDPTIIYHEPVAVNGIQQQPSVIPFQFIQQSDVRQAHTLQQRTTYTEHQINDLISKCRVFLLTLLKLTEKQSREKLPIVRSCIQDLLDDTIDPDTFVQRLQTLYTTQPHSSIVLFFKLALPHMRQIVKNTFGRPITIELIERLRLPTNKSK